MQLFRLPILESADLNLKACAFKFLIVVCFFVIILFYFNYSSIPVANGLYIYIYI